MATPRQSELATFLGGRGQTLKTSQRCLRHRFIADARKSYGTFLIGPILQEPLQDRFEFGCLCLAPRHFWLPHFVAQRLFCAVTAKRDGNKQSKGSVKALDS